MIRFIDWFSGGELQEQDERHKHRMVIVTSLLVGLISGIYLLVWIGLLGSDSSPISVGMLMVSLFGSVSALVIERGTRRVSIAAFVIALAVIANLSVACLVQGGFERLQLVGLTLTPLFIAYVGGIRLCLVTATIVFFCESLLFVLQERGFEFERMVSDDLMAMDALASGLTGAMFIVVFGGFYVSSIKRNTDREVEMIVRFEKIRARSRLKADFVSVLGHELEMPLKRIARRVKRTRGVITALDDQRQIKNLEMLTESSAHLRTIIGDLLDLERIEAGTITRSDFSILVPKLVQDVVNSHLPAAEKKQMRLIADIKPTRRLISDPVRVRQILDNLVTNAIKYSERGTVSLKSWEDAEGIHFTVADEGIGIERDKLSAIFEPMYQVDQTRSRRQDGVGLGLYIVRQLVHLLGGTLRVRSKVGKGTIFTLSFPPRMIDSRDS